MLTHSSATLEFEINQFSFSLELLEIILLATIKSQGNQIMLFLALNMDGTGLLACFLFHSGFGKSYFVT